MKALSLWQPWASLVADGRKRIETRSWRPPEYLIGKRLAIHATKKVDTDAAEEFGYKHLVLPRGAIVAVVYLDSWMHFTEENTEYITDEEKRYGDFYPGRFGWVFTDITKLPIPYPMHGWQGLFDCPDWVAKNGTA